MSEAATFAEFLNPPQAKAVTHIEGPLLVFAGAGSGKTRVITFRIANLIARHGAVPYRILAVTFTNKAAGEMRERLGQLLGEDVAQDIWVGTFHAICCKLLRRYHESVGLSKSFVIYDDSDQKAVVTRVIRDLNLDEKLYVAKNCLAKIHKFKQEGMRPEDIDPAVMGDPTLHRIFCGYEAYLKASSACDFDDLLVHITRLAEDRNSPAGEELRKRFDFVLVDEFQDVNHIQYRLVRALSANSQNLCVVGDDDQSIYRWRGADVRNIRGFRHDFPSAVVIKLEENYRSTQRIVRAALAVIGRSKEREPKELFTNNDEGAPIYCVKTRDERDEAAMVVSKVKEALEAGVAPTEIAVFYRIHAMSRVLEEALRSENVAYRIVGGTRFFERAEIKNMLAYLRCIENPRSDVDLLRIINTPARGIGNGTIKKLMDKAFVEQKPIYEVVQSAGEGKWLGTAARKRVMAFGSLMESLQDMAATAGPSDLAAEVLNQSGYRQALLKQNNAEADARLENIQEMIGSLEEYKEEIRQVGETATLAGYLEKVSLATAGDEAAQGECISLMTVHSSKGLEFKTVLIIGLEEDMFPYVRRFSNEEPDLEEERRLAYVAITRAREVLVLSHCMARTLFGNTKAGGMSRFIAEIPKDLAQHMQTKAAEAGLLNPLGMGGGAAWGSRGGWGQSSGGRSGGYGNGRSGGRSSFGAPEPRRQDRGSSYVEYDAETAGGEEGVTFYRGMAVSHKKYGEGEVQALHEGMQPSASVKFPGWGVKKILVRFLRPA